MPVLTQAEKAQINVNKQKLVELSPDASSVILKGHNPVAILEVESGGIAGAFQMYDMVDPNHMVSSIQWVKATQETDWTLSDKDTGVIKAMFQMKPDGTFHIGNGMVQHQIATDTDLGEVINLLLGKIITKADKTSLPTIYSGDTVPLDSLGKDLDWYHHYESGTTIVEEIIHGTSLENYSDHGFYLAKNTNPIPASGVHTIEIFPLQGRMVYIDLEHDKTLATEELTLIIGNDSVVLEELSNAAGSYSGFYPASADAIIQGITDTTQYVLQAKTGHTDDKEVDYEKHHGVWEREDFLNNTKVNELIREYSTIVVMSLADDKKPTRSEAIHAFKQLPHFDWTKNDTFYIRDSTGAKTMFCTYFADSATNEATAGMFFFKDMNECV